MYSQPNLFGTDQEKLTLIHALLSQEFPHVTWKVEKAHSPTVDTYLDIATCVVLLHDANFNDTDKTKLFEWYVGKIPEFVLRNLI